MGRRQRRRALRPLRKHGVAAIGGPLTEEAVAVLERRGLVRRSGRWVRITRDGRAEAR